MLRSLMVLGVLPLAAGLLLSPNRVALAQEQGEEPPETRSLIAAPMQQVDVEPIAEDEEIQQRLLRILEATGWFIQPGVRVEEGVVFLSGSTESESARQWAEELAGNTQDVVAVVNHLEVREGSLWDLSPAWEEISALSREGIETLPLLLVALLMLLAFWWLAGLSIPAAHYLLRRKYGNPLLLQVASRAVAVPVFLFGLYLVLRISGLTRLAVTVLGGTGLVGLVIGIAFRDIAENFLASILISIQRPFEPDDLIDVAGQRGFVQRVTTRGTLLMTVEGNHVQIPNATIYKETITNFSANPFVRCDFSIGIGYDDSVAQSQAVALEVMRNHPAVVEDPEPLVLVESLGSATVNLRCYFWIDAHRYSIFKVPSAVIRQTKKAFEDAGISMPDEAREVVFPEGVPLRGVSAEEAEESPVVREERVAPDEAADAMVAEGDLLSEAEDISEQAKKARPLETGTNLLESS